MRRIPAVCEGRRVWLEPEEDGRGPSEARIAWGGKKKRTFHERFEREASLEHAPELRCVLGRLVLGGGGTEHL